MKVNKLNESKKVDDYITIKEINWLKDNPGESIDKTHYSVSYNTYVDANTNEPMDGHFTVVENRGRDHTRVDDVQELKDYIVRRYNKYFTEDVSYDWKPNTSFKHIKDIYNKVKSNDYKYVNNEREEFMAAVKKAEAKGYKPEQNRQIKDWHRDIWAHNRKNEGYSHFEFTSGANPYIAKTKDEAERIKRSRGDSVRFVGNINGIDYYKVDDGEEKDLFRVEEAFKPAQDGIQSVKCYNRYNYTIQELRVDNDNKTFQRGQFTAGKPDKKTKNRQEFEDIVDTLKSMGYKELDSEYRSMRNKSRNGVVQESAKIFGAKAKKLNEWAPNIGECPACGDTSFDTKIGRCTKCSYRESLNESENYKVKFFQVFEAPKSPKENGKMIGQRGTLDDANAFGEEKVGKGNYIIKAVCDDGKTRHIDNDTKSSDYKMVESTSLIDKKFNTLGKAGKPMYLTNDQLTDMQAKFKDYDFEETNVDKSLPDGQKAYVAKKKGLNEDVEYIVPKDVQDKWGNQPILHDEDQWNGKYKTFADMWKGEDYKLEEASYGGAFDIEDDQFFTREEINEFAYEVCENLNEIFPTFFDVVEVYMERGNVLELTVQDEEGNEFTSKKKIDMRKIKKPSDLNRAYAGDVVYDIRRQCEGFFSDGMNESLDTEAIVGPDEGPEFGLSELLNTAIQNELQTVSEYNTLALNARSEGFEDIAMVIEEINTEENKHIGQLQELLKVVSPNASAIDDGRAEGEEQLSNPVHQEI